jgi:hypothetical protein
LQILGSTVSNAANAKPLFTTGAGNTITAEIQVGAAIGAAPPDANDAGIVSFDSSMFSVDANGFVQLVGGGMGIDSIGVDAFIAPGTNPVFRMVLGLRLYPELL